jgi:hypothetical protein
MGLRRRVLLAGVGTALAGAAGCSGEPSPTEQRARRALESDRAFARSLRGVAREERNGGVAVGVDYFLQFEPEHDPPTVERRANATALAVGAAFYGSDRTLIDLFVRGFVSKDDAGRIEAIDETEQDVIASAVGLPPGVAADADLAAMDPGRVPEVASPYVFKPKLFE